MNVLAWPARSRNPYIDRLYAEIRRRGVTVDEFSLSRLVRGRYDIVHIHWPERAFRDPRVTIGSIKGLGFIGLLQFARLRGARVFWTVHNLQAHETRHPHLEPLFWKLFSRTVDAYIALSPGGQVCVRDRFHVLADRRGFIISLGHYRDAYPNEVSSGEARAALDIDPDVVVLAFVGFIRPYKNVPRLIRVFRASADAQTVLVVAGEVHSASLRAEVLEAAADDPRVRLFLDFVPDGKLQYFLNAADLVVLPHAEILNSASAMLGLSFDRPVLLPEKGAMGELRAAVGDEWIKTYHGDLNADVLRSGLAWALRTRRGGSPPLDNFGWPRLACETVQAYGAICSRECSRRIPSPRLGDARR